MEASGNGHLLPHPVFAGHCAAAAVVLAAPGISIRPAACEFDTSIVQCVKTGFYQWLLYWLECGPQGVTTSGVSRSSGSSTSASEQDGSIISHQANGTSGFGTRSSNSVPVAAPSTSRAASWLRLLWLRLKGRCYTSWMLWVAAALDRAGEQQLACEAAAQGMLPVSCHFWDIMGIPTMNAACNEALLPVLARSSRHLITRFM
jgi:hypothetical protein